MKANFSHVYSKYESAVLQPYTQFLESVFRKFRNSFVGRTSSSDGSLAESVRRARSIKDGLIQIKAASDDEEDSDESEEESESEVEQPPTQKAPRKKSISILTIYMPLLMHHFADARP